MPFVSVVIPVLNGEATIGACLSALVKSDYPKECFEILIVDNGSTDRTTEIAKRYPVTLLSEPRRGPARARNRGIEASRGGVLAFTDADCLVTTGWIRNLVAAFSNAEVGAVAGEILPFPPRTPAERYAARIRHLSPQRYLRRPLFPFAVTANLAFRRSVFAQVGLFDPTCPRGGESTDFCTRFFRQTRLRLELASRAVVFHRHRQRARDLFSQHIGYGRGHAFLYWKYRDELPWGWEQTRQVYADLLRTARGLARSSVRFVIDTDGREDLEFSYFEFLRKLALRLGFAQESLARGRVAL
ncbi:MAG: glycosyltransferase [Actinomycetota bacterium]|nr:glycosyltransferase [Actinomycetota bacterium]